MTGDNEVAQHCTLAEQADLLTALDAAAIEHLEVDEHRTIVIYQSAIIMVIVTEGRATVARAFDVELWKEPVNNPDRDLDDLLTAFLDELLATTDTAHR
ncbi:hypothetical protein [Natronomonas sp. EA1]|uniref:hypothetical protein n=1 Tax=Natronomonas sp. EA1 TaxID=3421655 RepID=UPI003EBC7C61